MKAYSYCVNTFKNDKPVQLSGFIEANSEEDSINRLIQMGIIDSSSYEFLELHKHNLKNITLERMLKLEVADLLAGYPKGGKYYYFKDDEGIFSEIMEFDLFRGRFITDNGDFSEFEWELKESHIYIEE